MRFQEKGGKDREIPIRSTLDAWLTAYLEAGGLQGAPGATPLFRALDVRDWRRLTAQPVTAQRIRAVLKTRLRAAGLPPELCPHSFRVFVVTDLLLQHVPLEDVQPLGLVRQLLTFVFSEQRDGSCSSSRRESDAARGVPSPAAHR